MSAERACKYCFRHLITLTELFTSSTRILIFISSLVVEASTYLLFYVILQKEI